MTEREALIHLRTLIDVASDSADIDSVQKLLIEMGRIVDKALPPKKRQPRSAGSGS